MANTIFKLKKSSVAGRTPDSGDLAYGELAINYHDGKLYYKNDANNISSFSDDAGQNHYTSLDFDSDFGTRTADDVPNGTTNTYYSTTLFDSDLALKNTGDLAEGINLYYTLNRADSDAKNAVSVTDAGGDGSLSYDNSTGIITYTGPSATEVRSHFAATGDLNYDSATGVFSFASGATYTSTTFDSDFGTKTTDDLTEGSTNLYYTTARADSDITVKVDAAFINALTIDADTLGGQAGSYYHDYTNLTNTPNVLDSSDVLTTVASFGYATQTYVTNALAVLPDSAQVSAIITADVDAAFINALTIDADTLGGQAGSYYLDYTNFTNTPNVLDSADVRNIFSVSGDLAYNSGTGQFSVTTYKTANFNSDLATKTTADVTEGSNLYYTTARTNSDFDTRLATKSTTNVAEGSNLYYTTARANSDFDTRLATKSTTNVTEGSNLYYTTTRANSDFDTRLATKSTTNVAEGSNLYYTTVRADARIALQVGANLDLSSKTTTNVAEGTNLYYTNARADARIAAASITDLSDADQTVRTTDNVTFGNITSTGYIAGPAVFIIDPAGVGDNTGKVVIAGDLQVDGTTTTINSTTVSVDDLNLTLASGAATASAANGAGITIDGASATFTYVSASDRWTMNKVLAADLVGNVTGNAASATALATSRTIAITGDITGTATAFNGTSNIAISSAITAGSIVNADINAGAAIVDTKLNTISTAGKVLNSATTATSANTASAIVARDASGNFTAGTITATTFIGDGSSLTGLPAGYTITNFNSDLATKTTDNLTEGTNKYFATSLVDAHLSGSTGITYSAGAISITNTGVSANTYGDAANIPQFVVNAQGQITSVSNIAVNIPAGYTQTNFDSDVAAQSAELLTSIKTVDGAGSGLDADLLDGQQGAYYRINIYDNTGALLN